MNVVYSLSFAELLDRLSIVELRNINSKEPNEKIQEEIKDILHDIDLHLAEKPMSGEQVRGLIILSYVNKFIWDNESSVREEEDCSNQTYSHELLEKLKQSHKANSLRAEAKKHIQNQRQERIDEKLNYGKQVDMWNIKF